MADKYPIVLRTLCGAERRLEISGCDRFVVPLHGCGDRYFKRQGRLPTGEYLYVEMQDEALRKELERSNDLLQRNRELEMKVAKLQAALSRASTLSNDTLDAQLLQDRGAPYG